MLLVLVWHLQPLKVEFAGNQVLSLVADRLIRFFNFELTLIAVPAFFLVSLYLLSGKLMESPDSFPRRLGRLVGLYLFWFGVQMTLSFLLQGEIPPLSYDLLRNGGPGLPIVGGSVFFFLFDLIFLFLLLAFFSRMPDAWKRWVGVMVFLISAVAFEVAIFSEWIHLDYPDFINFFYLVPLAFLFFRNPQFLIRRKWWFLGAYVLLAFLHDVGIKLLLSPHPVRFPTYGRLSIAVGTIALCCFMLDTRIRSNRWIAVVARYSLGIFAIHKFCQLAAHYLIPNTGYYPVLGVGVHLQSLAVFILTAFLVVLALWFMRVCRLNAFIS